MGGVIVAGIGLFGLLAFAGHKLQLAERKRDISDADKSRVEHKNGSLIDIEVTDADYNAEIK